ncbi:MAG: gluconate 2-dehydrogenase subunit 3 family protein [Chromatiales bacterium]|nr:gluconate 2-dehydrogenase subunit 3 family protein [Chromatiales bacterium]
MTGARREVPGEARRRLDDWHGRLVSRRRFLISAAGGSLALVFGLPAAPAVAVATEPVAIAPTAAQWSLLHAVQNHLFPSEPDAPGAREIRALAYLRGVLADRGVDREEREFLVRGTTWLDEIAREREKGLFVNLDAEARERVLRQVAQSDAGENWLSTLLYYIFEALLQDPIYGGNPRGAGWQWLEHDPGQPRPNPRNRYRS